VDARLVAEALLDPDPRVHRAALVAASAKLAGRATVPALLAQPDGSRLPLSDWLAAEPDAPEPSASERAELLLWLAPELVPQAKRVAQSSAEGAQAVFQSLGGSAEKPLFLPLLASTEGLPLRTAEASFEVTRRLTAELLPAFEGLLRHPAVQMRTLAVAFMGKLEDARSAAMLLEALQDRAEAVRLAAVLALSLRPIQLLAPQLAQTLTKDSSWAVRLRAAEALTALEQPDEELLASVSAAALGDAYALVRQAAVTTIGRWEGPVVTQTLKAVSRTDRDATVRRAAESLLEGR
jgi:HEAT repeat protein